VGVLAGYPEGAGHDVSHHDAIAIRRDAPPGGQDVTNPPLIRFLPPDFP